MRRPTQDHLVHRDHLLLPDCLPSRFFSDAYFIQRDEDNSDPDPELKIVKLKLWAWNKITFKGRLSPHSFYSNIYKLISDLDWHRMDYETYETDRVYDSMERNSGVDEVCGAWIKIYIVEFVIFLMQGLYSILRPPRQVPNRQRTAIAGKRQAEFNVA